MQEDTHLFQGMRRDNHPIRQDSKFLWDARNIRFTAVEDNTLLSITNERGTSDSLANFSGKYLGHCIIGEYLIIFTYNVSDNLNHIYRINKQSLVSEPIYSGQLGMFSAIQTLGIFEGPLVQKVYWVDGSNPPRVINIVKDKLMEVPYTQAYTEDNTQFDFVQELSLQEHVTIERQEGSGVFAPGVIQYCFSYYNKYGQESNIFYTSGLQYSSPINRGGNPEEPVSNVFSITVQNVDRKFQYMRIYSVQRTSIDAVPTVKRIVDIPITADELTYVDTGTVGDIVDPTKLLYIGGENIVAGTIEQKDNTLFLGNIEVKRSSITNSLREAGITDMGTAQSSSRTINIGSYTNPKSFYTNTHQMPKGNTSGFKTNERYRVGVQFQYKNGKWSEPVFIQDVKVTNNPNLSNESPNGQMLTIPQIDVTIPAQVSAFAKQQGYVKARAVVVYPQVQDREVFAQGMLCPTVFSVGNRKNNTPFAQSSWFIRPNLPVDYSDIKNTEDIDKGAWVEFRHLQGLLYGTNRGAEIQGMGYTYLEGANSDFVTNNDAYSSGYMVDQSIITMHSPDIEFDDNTQQAIDGSQLKFRIVGLINFTANSGDIDIETSSPPINSGAPGFYHRPLTAISDSSKPSLAARSLVSGMFYRDAIVDDSDKNATKYNAYPKDATYSFMVYPWHRSGSLNNDTNRPQDRGTRTAVLKKKRISNLKFSAHNTWLPSPFTLTNGITPVSIFNSNEMSMIKVPTPESSGIASIVYYGNVDTAITHKYKYSPLVTIDTITNQFNSNNIKSVKAAYSTIGNGDSSLTETSEPIRMRYKSTPHAVFALNHLSSGSVWNNPVCLPSVNNLNRVDISVVPFWTEKIQIQDDPLKGYTVLDCHYGRDRGPDEDPPTDNLPLVASYPEYYDGVDMYCLCKWVSGQGWVIDKETMQSQMDKMIAYNPIEESYSTLYFRVTHMGSGPVLRRIDIGTTNNVEYKLTQDNISASTDYPTLFLAELYRDRPENQFGGDTPEAKRSNLWFPAGDAVALSDAATKVSATYGDTWYQRYDCLKTYPFTQEDENSIIEIASFMCETRVNIDGRYDRNRGQSSNLNISPQNFNLLNKVYTQRNNFFNYRIFDQDYYKVIKFPNQVLWSTQKSHLEETDSWTNITLASSIDLDGNRGDVQAIVNFNDNLYCFQDQSLSQLLFNSRVQIPASDGVPIEIGNNYKMEGSRIIADQVGCQDKLAMVTTPNGIYFVDAITKALYLFNGQLTDLGATHGMSIWARENCTTDPWYFNQSGMRLCYDPRLRDVYFIPGTNGSLALCYSEALGQFTSTYDYGGAVLFSLDGNMYAVYNYDGTSLYKMFSGPYTNIFGDSKPYHISFISNDGPTITKIFDTVEFRADIDGEPLKKPFSYIRAENEYQDTGEVPFNSVNLRKKFRIWRALVPRDNKVKDGIRSGYGLSRIRNPWTKITLGSNQSDGRLIFHDLSVKYTV